MKIELDPSKIHIYILTGSESQSVVPYLETGISKKTLIQYNWNPYKKIRTTHTPKEYPRKHNKTHSHANECVCREVSPVESSRATLRRS